MRPDRALACLLVLGTALAGCSGSPPSAPTTGPPPEDRGSIDGSVTTIELEPIPGAQLAVRGDARGPAISDAGGHFRIDDLPAGTHVLYVSALGYDAVARSVDVQASEVSQLRFSLAPLASDEPHAEMEEKKGLIACGSGAGASGGGFTQVECGSNDPNQRFLFNYSFGANLAGILLEMAWTPSQALSKDLVLIVEKAGCGFDCGVSDTFAEVQGCCRIRAFLTVDQLSKPAGFLAATDFQGEAGTIQTRTFPAFGESTTPLTVFTGQEFRIYAEYYYNGVPGDVETRSNVPAQ